MKTEYQYIRFVKIGDGKSTWECRNKKSGDTLGRILFYYPWHQHCFFPEPFNKLVFNVGCMQDICHFIGQLRAQNTIRRNEQQQAEAQRGLAALDAIDSRRNDGGTGE